MEWLLGPFCRKFWEFLFLHFGQFSGNFRNIREIFPGIVPASKFCLVGVVLFGAGLSRKRAEKRSQVRFPPRRILLDMDDEEEDAHEEDHNDDKDDKD